MMILPPLSHYNISYPIYRNNSIKRPGRLFNFWAKKGGVYSRGAFKRGGRLFKILGGVCVLNGKLASIVAILYFWPSFCPNFGSFCSFKSSYGPPIPQKVPFYIILFAQPFYHSILGGVYSREAFNRGGRLLRFLLKKGGVYSRGAFKRRGRLIELLRQLNDH